MILVSALKKGLNFTHDELREIGLFLFSVNIFGDFLLADTLFEYIWSNPIVDLTVCLSNMSLASHPVWSVL